MGNPIKYTSRTFNTIMADFNADALLADKPEWSKRMAAGVGDVLSVWQDAAANQAFLRTAFTRRAVEDLCQWIDYVMSGRSTSLGSVMFDLSPDAALPVTVSAANLVAVQSSSGKRFEARAALAASISTEATLYTAWAVATGIITVASAFTSGEKVRLSTSGVLPAGLSASVDYFAIYLSSTTVKLAASRAEALAGTAVAFTDQGSGTHTMTRLSRAVVCYQQQSVDSYSLGQSDGLTAFQSFNIGQVGLIRDTLTVTINGVVWTRVDSLIYSLPSDTHYRLVFNTDLSAQIEFGDGTYGAIPGAYDVYAGYAYGGGSDSNVSGLNQITVYGGSDSALTGCFNTTTFVGGGDEETLDHAKRYAPMLLKARDRFVTDDDGVALVQNYGGVMQCKINRNVYGILSCQVLGIAAGGGDAGSALRALIETYLIERSVLDDVDVHFDASTITPENVTASIKLLSGYTWASVSAYASLAFKLFFSEVGFEIKSVFDSSGISDAVTLINTVFGTAFVEADHPSIQKIVGQWDQIGVRQYGDTIELSDINTFVQGGVNGIDYFTMTAPTLPLACGADEITTSGTVTLVQL